MPRKVYPSTCTVEGCSKPYLARGYCNAHYQMWRLHGSPLYGTHLRRQDPVKRFWSKVTPPSDPAACWEWGGRLDHNGYGIINGGVGRYTGAHRFSYIIANGPVAEGLVIDHLCRNITCVNPRHLEAVPQRENVLRGKRGRLVTHCPQGHEYTADNIYWAHGRRSCRECIRTRPRVRPDAAYWREYRRKRTAAGRPVGSKQ